MDWRASCSFERIRAGVGFLGYYNNLDLTSTCGDVALTEKLRIGGAATIYSQMLGNPFNILTTIPENRYFQGQISYLYTKSLQVVASGRYMAMKDLSQLAQFNLRQSWGDLRLYYTLPGLLLTGCASLGWQRDQANRQESWPLQMYSLYACCNRWSDTNWNLLFETGNLQYYDVTKWRSSIGGGVCHHFSCSTSAANSKLTSP